VHACADVHHVVFDVLEFLHVHMSWRAVLPMTEQRCCMCLDHRALGLEAVQQKITPPD